jgi:hypothetical protein
MDIRRPLPFVLLAAVIAACAQQPAPPAASPLPATSVTTVPAPAPTQAAAPTAPAATAVSATQTVATPALPSVPTAEPPPFARIVIPPISAELPAGFKPVSGGGFGTFELPSLQTTGRLPTVTQAANLDGVTVPILMSPQQRELVGRQGFVVSPSSAYEFFEVYERNRYDFLPSFITSDSILHGYHQAFDAVLRHSEMLSFSPILVQLDLIEPAASRRASARAVRRVSPRL